MMGGPNISTRKKAQKKSHILQQTGVFDAQNDTKTETPLFQTSC